MKDINTLPEKEKAKLDILRKDVRRCLKENAQRFYYLKARWQEEKEYEDFDEYIKIFKDIFKKYDLEEMVITKAFKITVKKLGWKTYFGLNYNGITFKYKRTGE